MSLQPRAPVVSLLGGIARVTARADVSMAQTAPVPLYFDAPGIVRTAATTTPVASLTGSLLDDLDLELEILQFNLLGGALSGAVGTVESFVAPLAPVLDTVLVALFDALGVGVGEVDVALRGFDCRNAALVQ